LRGQEEQGVVTSADPGAGVRSGEQGVDLVTVEVAHDGGGRAFAWDRQHTLDDLGVLGGAECGVAKQRVDGGQAGVAGGRAVTPFGLQVVVIRSASSWCRPSCAGAAPVACQAKVSSSLKVAR
jgi:hypothetical protein